MNDLSIADIERNVVDRLSARIEQKVTRLDLRQGDLLSVRCLISRSTSGGNSKMLKDPHRKSGTVRSVCQACPTVYIRISEELFRISHDRCADCRIIYRTSRSVLGILVTSGGSRTAACGSITAVTARTCRIAGILACAALAALVRLLLRRSVVRIRILRDHTDRG